MTDRRFAWTLAIAASLLAILPAIYALLTAPPGSRYLGYQYNTDDQMVYAAWMRQAMDGRFFFDNRFTTDVQPGLTVHVYFFLLGLVAKVTGIPVATTLARAGFSILFVWLSYRLIRRFEWEPWVTKLALGFVVFGGGLGFLVWHRFGQVDNLHPPGAMVMSWATDGLPVDVWQPEGFVFPAMLTNSLFMVSLCLILIAFDAFLAARDSWRAVLAGALALGVLMNIHSYDTLLIGFVLVGFLAASAMQRQITGGWILRALVIAAGMVIPALWFMYVLRHDPVFQSRAATKTFSPNFRQVVFGYLPLMSLGLYGVYARQPQRGDPKLALGREEDEAPSPEGAAKRVFPRWLGAAGAALIYAVLFASASGTGDSYYLGAPAFIAAYLLLVVCVALSSDTNPFWNLVVAWAFIGVEAIYFPGLFQRKLTMGLSVPWAILAGYGLSLLLMKVPASSRRLAGGLAAVVFGATSLLWLVREISFVRSDVSNTTRHPVYLTDDDAKIIDYLNQQPGRKVVLAVPGGNNPTTDASGQKLPDSFESPALPDLAPIISGLTGAYTYAGHWSETPDYEKRIGTMYGFFLDQPLRAGQAVMSPDERRAFESSIGANYAVVPMRDAYPGAPFATPEELGTVVVSGKQFSLVRLK